MKKLFGLCVSLIALILINFSIPVNAQKTPDTEYFAATGHMVDGEFLVKFRSISNAIEVFGFPITEDYPLGDIRVQYFQRARFEYHPNNPPDFRVIISDLGTKIWELEKNRFTELAQPPINSPACQLIAGSDYPICEAFRDFYNSNDGQRQFGKPISNVGKIGDNLVQYFERARFEWHPERKSGQRVVLTKLGEIYFGTFENQQLSIAPMFTQNGAYDSAIANIPLKNIQVNAFPKYASMEINGTQKVFIIVQDQLFRPVENANVKISVTLPSGETLEETYSTNENGIAVMPFQVGESYGLVEIKVIASLPNIAAQTKFAAFRIR